MTGSTIRNQALLCATAVVALSTLAACGGDENLLAPRPLPFPTPTPIPPPQHVATPVPFNLAQSRPFDILDWHPPTPSAIQFRWNAAEGKYEVLVPGDADWNRLEARQNVRSGETPLDYDVFGSDGTALPFKMTVLAPPHRWPTDGYVGNAYIPGGSSARAYFAFGIATQPGDVPVRGTMTCTFGEDEIGDGRVTFDLAAGTVSGWAAPYWATVQYPLVQTSFAPGATTFAVTFGTDGVLEGRFFGPGAVNVAVRANGGGSGFAAVSGIMKGVCER